LNPRRAVGERRDGSKALGYRIRRLFVGVFVAGSALAGPGRRHVGPLPGENGDGGDRRAGLGRRAGVHSSVIIGRLGALVRRLIHSARAAGSACRQLCRFLAATGALGSNHPDDLALILIGWAAGVSYHWPRRWRRLLRAILSDDMPRSRWLAGPHWRLVLLIRLAWVGRAVSCFPAQKSLNVGRQIASSFVLGRESFDLCGAYTRHRLVSPHTMFSHRRILLAWPIAVTPELAGRLLGRIRWAFGLSWPASSVDQSCWRSADGPVQPGGGAHDSASP